MVPLPPLHVVTDDAVLARPGFAALALAVLAAGRGRVALHLRGPATGGARLYALAAALRGGAAEAGALLIANDRVDLARVAGLDGVHLGRRSLPPREARRLLPAGARVGVSVHDPEAARAAERGGADYLVVGTVFATASHPDRPGSGPEGVARVGAAAGLPLLAIGGIVPDRIAVVRAAGAAGVAALSGVWDAPDPAAAVTAYLDAWCGAAGGPSGPAVPSATTQER